MHLEIAWHVRGERSNQKLHSSCNCYVRAEGSSAGIINDILDTEKITALVRMRTIGTGFRMGAP